MTTEIFFDVSSEPKGADDKSFTGASHGRDLVLPGRRAWPVVPICAWLFP